MECLKKDWNQALHYRHEKTLISYNDSVGKLGHSIWNCEIILQRFHNECAKVQKDYED